MRFEFNDDSQKICNSADVANYGIQCDICGNKVLSVSNINGKRYCAGCHYKTFIKDNQQTEIDQLKQQLEEYENKGNTSAVNSWDEMLKNCENCGLNECIGCEYTQTCVQNIKQQLAEKDKEIERLKERLSVFDDFKDNYGYTNYDDSEILEDLQSRAFQAEDDTRVVNELLQFFNIFDENELVDKVKEPQTQLAIQELEKVKTLIQNAINFEKPNFVGVYDAINKQIKELKGEKQ